MEKLLNIFNLYTGYMLVAETVTTRKAIAQILLIELPLQLSLWTSAEGGGKDDNKSMKVGGRGQLFQVLCGHPLWMTLSYC